MQLLCEYGVMNNTVRMVYRRACGRSTGRDNQYFLESFSRCIIEQEYGALGSAGLGFHLFLLRMAKELLDHFAEEISLFTVHMHNNEGINLNCRPGQGG